VVPTIGPHKGHPHTVIHVHSTGEVNIKPKGLTGKRNRYRMGATTAQPHHLNPHTVAESAACPDCGCDPCKCKKMNEDHVQVGDRVHAGFGSKGGVGFRGVVKKMDGNGHVHVELDKDPHDKFGPRKIIAPHHHVTKESLDEEMAPSHKGSHQYTGKIGGKTYVVPHATYSSFEPEHKKPLSHSTVTSREHVAKHNKNMSPEEIDKIHQHIQQVHKESVEEGYTTMKGKESFMKKKPLDVKYGSRWQVMSHGKTMERPTKEEVELDESEPQTHKVMVTVSDPNHPMVHKRKELIAKRVAVKSHTKEGAVEKAKKFYRNSGYKVHDAEHHSIMPSTTMKTEETQLDEKFINGRQYASHGLMHPEHAGLPIHQKTGREIDFYASGTGDKISGKVTKNDGKHVRIQAHKTHGGKLHVFKVTPHLPKTQNEEVKLEEASLKDACWKGFEAIGMKEKGGKKVPNCVPVNEQTPSGGVGGPESAGVPMGGDISTKTVTGSDTAPKSTRKQEILKDVMKSAKEKQKQKIGGKSEFEKDPEYHPLVITQQ
jgi:hypothetical protein